MGSSWCLTFCISQHTSHTTRPSRTAEPAGEQSDWRLHCCFFLKRGDVVMLDAAFDADARSGVRDEEVLRKQHVYVPRSHSEAVPLSSGKPVCVAAPASRSRDPPSRRSRPPPVCFANDHLLRSTHLPNFGGIRHDVHDPRPTGSAGVAWRPFAIMAAEAPPPTEWIPCNAAVPP